MTKLEEHANGEEPEFQSLLTPRKTSSDHCFNDELKKRLW